VSRKELDGAFAEGWLIESVEASEYEIRPDSAGFNPSERGPKAWFVVARRV